jgi:hypothetical protein
MILTYTKDFPWKNGPDSPDFEIKIKISDGQIFMISSSR